ncbi:unnamed protein product [Prorocentrum cordatum]|uniref:Saccharopine dehydrogenase NADP binding domain-containing protein n=1 Tax=Prorocentrum cordatum TaxID=2364126 RepID=A0ABN9QRY2_9DINO|nr:unnamed protein product [Polarella glacialis]
MARKYDAVIFGASGFTGVQVCRQAQRLRPFASWAAAGRSAGRLREAVAQLDASAAKPDIIVADVESHDSLVAMAQQARLVVNVTGPFRFLGEGVVRACIEAGTDYVDICGEPEFMERTLLRYQEAAVAAGVIVCHACAFDSIPADLGVIHSALLYRRAGGTCTGVEAFHSIEAPLGYTGHATTFEAAVHGVAAAPALARVRRSATTKGMVTGPSHLGLQRSPPSFLRPPRYALPFMGSDASVVRSSRRLLANVLKDPAASELRPQFGIYFTLASAASLAKVLAFGALCQALASCSLGRWLLVRCPRLFTCGAFSSRGPTEEQMANNSVTTTFFSQGEVGGVSCSAVLEVGCDDPGYVGTGMMVCGVAATLLAERWALDVEGGVFTPGALFYKSGLVGRLKKHGLRFEVVRSNIPS